jgi:hypothetical protein
MSLMTDPGTVTAALAPEEGTRLPAITAIESVPAYPQASTPARDVPHTGHPAAAPAVPVPAPAAAPAAKPVRRWPLLFIGSPAAVAVWSGWVGLGGMCGFGPVHPLPGIADSFVINTAITLPIGIEAYGMYALGAWLNPMTPESARKFAKLSGIGSLALGMCGQVIYHLLAAAGDTKAPWPVVMLVSCLPVIALGLGTALAHLIHASRTGDSRPAGPAPEPVPADVPAGPAQVQADAEPVREIPPGHPEPDTEPETSPPASRTPRRTPKADTARPAARTPRSDAGTAAAVARLREKNPELPARVIAERLGVSARTVRRHLADQAGAPPAETA